MKNLLHVICAILILFSVSAYALQNEIPAESAGQSKIDTSGKEAPTAILDFQNAVIRIAKENIPAVVHIEVTQKQEVENPFYQFEQNPFFRHFFDMPQAPRKFKRELKGIGTGMIIDEAGHILTNYHVVAGAAQIEVILSSGSQYQAKIIGTDPKTDLAVIKVSAQEKLPHVIFGDSDTVEVGEWVVAIGHPRGLDQTVTQGIISAKHRRGIIDPSSYEDFLQTDAAINPGNSGGPLLNLKGEVIGVNAVIVSQSGGYEGIGFAIPSNMALHITKALIDTGKIERGWLGVTIQDVSFDKLKALKLDSAKGAYVMDVVEGSPADKGGIKTGDVILSVNARDVADASDMRNQIASATIGSDVRIDVLREGTRLTLNIKVGSREEAARTMTAVMRKTLGVDVRPLKEDEIKKYNVEENRGVAISWLDPSGPVAKAGLEIDDVILSVDNQSIVSGDDLASVAGIVQKPQVFTMLIVDHRTGRTGSIQVKVE